MSHQTILKPACSTNDISEKSIVKAAYDLLQSRLMERIPAKASISVLTDKGEIVERRAKLLAKGKFDADQGRFESMEFGNTTITREEVLHTNRKSFRKASVAARDLKRKAGRRNKVKTTMFGT